MTIEEFEVHGNIVETLEEAYTQRCCLERVKGIETPIYLLTSEIIHGEKTLLSRVEIVIYIDYEPIDK